MDTEHLLRSLNDHNVEFVIIGATVSKTLKFSKSSGGKRIPIQNRDETPFYGLYPILLRNLLQ